MIKHSFIRHLAILIALAAGGPLFALGWRASLLATSPFTLAFAGGGLGWAPHPALIDVNPAHVWGIESESVGYGHLRMFGDLRGSVLAWQGIYRGRPTELRLRTVSENGIELRGDIPTAEPLGLTSARLLTATATRGWRFLGGQLGVSLTGAYQRIYLYDARGMWLSAGWTRSLADRLSWGVALTRVGFAEALGGRTLAPLPSKVGTGLMLTLSPLIGSVGIDITYDGDFGMTPAVMWANGGDTWGLQAAAQVVGDEVRLAVGLAIDLGNWSAGYALSYQNSTLGLPQMFQVSRNFRR